MNLKITCKYPEHTVTTPTGSEEHKFDKAILKGLLENHGCTDVNIVKLSSKRTISQNSALWKWYEQIVSDCQDRGQTIDLLFQQPSSFFISKEFLHEFTKGVIKYQFKKDGSSNLNKEEFSKIIEMLKDIFAERLDCQIEFPNRELLIYGEKKNI